MLPDNWLTDKYIDFEYKKYLVLAYLNAAGEQFNAIRLYPHLSELIVHYKRLLEFRRAKRTFDEQLPRDLKGIDPEQMRLIYERLEAEDDLLRELEDIVNYALPKFKYYMDEGKDLYDHIKTKLNIEPVGVVPIYQDEGYLLLDTVSKPSGTVVYRYTVSLYGEADAKYRSVRTEYVMRFDHSPDNTFERIKSRLIKDRRDLPNPATYAVEADLSLPLHETFLPVAKRILVKYIETDK